MKPRPVIIKFFIFKDREIEKGLVKRILHNLKNV